MFLTKRVKSLKLIESVVHQVPLKPTNYPHKVGNSTYLHEHIMKFLLQQKLCSRFLQTKYDIPVFFYSSLQPSVKKPGNESSPQIGTKGAPLKIKPKRDPFLKNILIGKFDVEMLIYPEILDLEKSKNIERMSHLLDNYFKGKYLSTVLSNDFLTEMTNFGLSKLKIPYSHNGLELTASESARITEVVGMIPHLVNYFSCQIIVQETLALASDVIKDKYFKNIVEDSAKGTVCLNEVHSEFDFQQCKTNASWSDTHGTNVLNGKKIWVTHADIADFFIVLGHFNGSSVFIVDKNKPGITINKHQEDGYFTVDFKDTPIDDSEILTADGKGLETSYRIQRLSMFYYSSAVLGMLKDVFHQTTQLTMYRPLLEKHCSDFEATQITLSKLASEIYALESMLYFTANLIDGYEQQDSEVEIAVLKLFASKVSHNVITECINLLGPHVTMRSYQYPFMETLCTIKRLSQQNFSDDLVKLFIAIKCIEHGKQDLGEYIKKICNPYVYFNEALKHTYYTVKNDRDAPKLDLHLHKNLHPSLKVSANSLEYCIKRLEYTNINLLEHFGAEAYNHQYSLLRITNIITDIYAMTSTLSRSSRSLSKGIQSSDLEVICANSFCQTALKNVKTNVNEILAGEYDEIDFHAKRLSRKIFSSKGYFADHPLARNII